MIDQFEVTEVRNPTLKAQPFFPGESRDLGSMLLNGDPGNESSANIPILIVHEDPATGRRARQVLDRLVSESGFNLRFDASLWTFDALREPLLHERALRDVSDVQIVIISMHGDGELPLAVCDLLNHWFSSKEEPGGVLVASFDIGDREVADNNAALNCLRAKAVAGGVDLFPHFGVLPEETDWDKRGLPTRETARANLARHGIVRGEPFRAWD